MLAAEAPHVASPRLRVTVDEAAGSLAALEAGLVAVKAELQRGSGGNDSGSNSSSASGCGGSDALLAMATDLERQLADARALLQRCRDGFASLAAYYGESAAALPSEQELWLPLQAFVDRFSATQRAVAAEQKEEADRLRRQASGGTPGSSRRPSMRLGSAPGSQQQLADGGSGQPTNAAAAPAAAAEHGPVAAPASQAAEQEQPQRGSTAALPEAQPVDPPPPWPASAARQLEFHSPPAAAASSAAADDVRRLQELLQGMSDDD